MKVTTVTSRQRLAENLRNYRKKEKISREELAFRCGISARQLADIETCKCSTTVDTVDRLSEGTGIDPCEILFQLNIEHPAARKLSISSRHCFSVMPK